MSPQMPQENGSSAGPIIGAIVILAVIIFGVLYFMDGRNDADLREDLNSVGIGTQSSSDGLDSIEADLDATDIENADYDLNEENFTSS